MSLGRMATKNQRKVVLKPCCVCNTPLLESYVPLSDISIAFSKNTRTATNNSWISIQYCISFCLDKRVVHIARRWRGNGSSLSCRKVTSRFREVDHRLRPELPCARILLAHILSSDIRTGIRLSVRVRLWNRCYSFDMLAWVVWQAQKVAKLGHKLQIQLECFVVLQQVLSSLESNLNS